MFIKFVGDGKGDYVHVCGRKEGCKIVGVFFNMSIHF